MSCSRLQFLCELLYLANFPVNNLICQAFNVISFEYAHGPECVCVPGQTIELTLIIYNKYAAPVIYISTLTLQFSIIN